MTSTYIETGNRVRVYDSAVQAHDDLPLGTYRVCFAPMDGFSLQKIDDLIVGDEQVYGGRETKVDKIFRTYTRSDRSLGVMLSGDKGQGKSLFLRMVAERAHAEGIPVILVTEDYDGLAVFLDSLDECMVVFDEFEKVFPNRGSKREGSDGENRQNQFLSLFDGMSSTKRLYCVTVNDVLDVSAYLVNRPGRFHYHMRFDYPGPQQVREYLGDQAPKATATEVESAAMFSQKVSLNYDHLRAIAFELNHPEAVFAEIVEDLNIKAVEPSKYFVEAMYADGSIVSGTEGINLFQRADRNITLFLRNGGNPLYFSFKQEDVAFGDDGIITIPVGKINVHDDDDEDKPEPRPTSITLTLLGQPSYAYGAV
jgi:hypothetical protein